MNSFYCWNLIQHGHKCLGNELNQHTIRGGELKCVNNLEVKVELSKKKKGKAYTDKMFCKFSESFASLQNLIHICCLLILAESSVLREH